MTTRPKFVSTSASVAAIVLVATLALSGCSGSSPFPPSSQDATLKATTAATDKPVDSGGEAAKGSDKSTSGDGSGLDLESVQSGKSIPADFPASIPLYKGEVIYGGGLTMDGSRMWTVKITCKDAASTLPEVAASLKAAGFTETFTTISGDEGVGMFDGRKDYSVMFAITKDGDHFEIGYVVSNVEK